MALKDYQPVKEMPKGLIQVPAFIDAFGEGFSSAYEKARQGNENFRLNNGRGSTPLDTGLVNKVFADNGRKFRTPVPTDNVYETIFPMIKGKFYSDMNALDVWDKKPIYERNTKIWKQVHELAEKHLGRKLEKTFRIQGFYCIPDKSKESYEVRIEPADNFRVIEDDRLNLESGTRFNELDENGIIIPDNKGNFTKYTLGNGLSRVFLNGNGDWDSIDDFLANSVDCSRVVVTNAEGVGRIFHLKNILLKYKKIIKKK